MPSDSSADDQEPYDDGEGDDLVRVSKLLSFLLRHRPDTLGLNLEAGGWVGLEALIERVNKRRKLPFPLQREMIESVVRQSGRFELRQGKIRARSGHSVRIERVKDLEAAPAAPEFLYLTHPARSLQGLTEHGQLLPLDGAEALRLVASEPVAAEGDEVLVVEAVRAQRQGIELRRSLRDDGWSAPSIPVRYVISLRPGFQRQISAGGVLVRGEGSETQFALIRTLPRSEAAPDEEPPGDESSVEEPIAEFSDPRTTPDRRASNDRRQQEAAPPEGVERRSGSRRQRRRRSGRWSTHGRLELPKGKLEPGETPAQAAVREVKEELGIAEALEVLCELSQNHYLFRTPEGGVVFKTVHYFMLRCRVDAPEFTPSRAEGIVAVEWWPAERAVSQVAFPNLRPILEKAWDRLR